MESLQNDQLEVLQTATTKDHFFKLLVSSDSSRVLGVKIFLKKTKNLIQQIDIDCDFRGSNAVVVEDYNFDGVEDFSIFESSYAGANSSRIYLLRTPSSEKYFISEISGVSLKFDHKTKTITEHNQCCAGTKHAITTYKLNNNKMVLIRQKCLEYNEGKDELEEVSCDE
jgi:hypothetical protein